MNDIFDGAPRVRALLEGHYFESEGKKPNPVREVRQMEELRDLAIALEREHSKSCTISTDSVAQTGRDNQAAPEASAVEHPGRGMSQVRFLPESTPPYWPRVRACGSLEDPAIVLTFPDGASGMYVYAGGQGMAREFWSRVNERDEQSKPNSSESNP